MHRADVHSTVLRGHNWDPGVSSICKRYSEVGIHCLGITDMYTHVHLRNARAWDVEVGGLARASYAYTESAYKG